MDWATILTAALPLVLLGLEYWLGKTDVVESNSILELIENIFRTLISYFSNKE